MDKFYTLDICGAKAELPILPLPSGISICFFNLHGNQALTEHCGKAIAKRLSPCDIIITAESKGLQLAHVVARELGQDYYAVCRNFRAVFQSEELRSYTLMTVGASALIVLNLVCHASWALDARTVTDSVFQVVTLMTTTGYMTYDYVLWPTFSQVILVLVMFAGACAGSTAGGIKQIRVVLLVKNLRREVQRILHPRVVTTLKSDGDRVDEPILSGISLFFFAYILLLLAGTLVVAWDDVGFTAAFTASLTCISNVGPAFDVLGDRKSVV